MARSAPETRAEDVRRLLQATLGEAALGPAEARREVDGAACPVLRPADGETLATALGVLGEHGLVALVRGHGTKTPPGAAAGAQVVLETGGLGGVHELDAEEGVARVGAGLGLPALREALAGSGWEAPLDPPGPGTVGGTLAAGAASLRHGAPRDAVLGLDVALATGERTRCGGRVVKNVTGYDLAKLHVGGFGALGVIEAAWLRLRPVPELVDVRALALPAGETGHALALAAARRPSARVAAVLDPETARGAGLAPVGEAPHPAPGAAVLLLELAGDAPAVEADVAWLADRAGLRAAGPEAVDRVRDLQRAGADAEGPPALRLRAALRATRVVPAAAALARDGARIVAAPGRGLLWARLPLAPEAGPEAADARLARARALLGEDAVLRVEAAPPRATPARGAFDLDPALAPLHDALRRRFDPQGVLATGRLFGGAP